MDSLLLSNEHHESLPQNISGEVYNDRQSFRDVNSGKFISRAVVAEVWQKLLEGTSEIVEVPEESIIKQKAVSYPSPQAKSRVISSYIGLGGIPLGGLDLIHNEIARKVYMGDEINWNKLVQTTLDAVKDDASKRGVSVLNRVETFENHASIKYKELRFNRHEIETELERSIDTSLESPERQHKNNEHKKTATIKVGSVLLGAVLQILSERKRRLF